MDKIQVKINNKLITIKPLTIIILLVLLLTIIVKINIEDTEAINQCIKENNSPNYCYKMIKGN